MSNYSDLAKKIAVSLVNVISKTWRIKICGEMPSSPAVVAFWHGSMLPVWKAFAKSGALGLVSQSKDGEMLCNLINKWGVETIRGSSSRGGSAALAEMTKLAHNSLLLITPDGPKGPIHKFKAGACVAAQRAQVPLYLANVKISCKKVFSKSWDKFVFPLPFAKIVISFNEPLYFQKNLDNNAVSAILNDCERMLAK